MTQDIYADYMPRSKAERARANEDDPSGLPSARIEQILHDWNDENWLQFAMWHTHQIKAYLNRVFADWNDDT